MRPIKLYGLVLDGPRCYAPAVLAPNETREFTDAFTPWPESASFDIFAAIRLHTANGDDSANIKAVPVHVAIVTPD